MAERDDARGDEAGDESGLAELRAAWRTLAPEDPAERLDEPDAATRATLDWLRTAWQASASDAPELRLPWRLRLGAARRRLRPLAPWLAAAGLLVALLREVTAPRGATQSGRVPSRGDLVVEASPDVAPVAPGPTVVHVPDPIALPDVIPLTAVDAQRMEMRRGPVRLILVQPTVQPTAPPRSPDSSHDAEPGSAKELR